MRSVGATVSTTNDATGDDNNSYFPIIAFSILFFFNNYGVWNIPWMILSEVFPSK